MKENDTFNDWLLGIAVVAFDLEIGQTLESLFPADAELSQAERLNLAYMAFPDSNSHCTRDTSYHFRLKRDGAQAAVESSRAKAVLTPAQLAFNDSVPAAMQADAGYLYGFVYFRQERREELPRGYYQKSIVLLSPLPLMRFFSEAVERVALAFFERGDSAIIEACQQIRDKWPSPRPGMLHISVPLLESEHPQQLKCHLPARALGSAASSSPHHHANHAETLLGQLLEDYIHPASSPVIHSLAALSPNKLHALWELMLLGEPLMVVGHTPADCSAAAQLLSSMIWPLRYAVEHRPYFTIHDTDFSAMVALNAAIAASKANAKNSKEKERGDICASGYPISLIGVTNPLFLKVLSHWPNTWRLNLGGGGGDYNGLGGSGSGTKDAKQKSAESKVMSAMELANKAGSPKSPVNSTAEGSPHSSPFTPHQHASISRRLSRRMSSKAGSSNLSMPGFSIAHRPHLVLSKQGKKDFEKALQNSNSRYEAAVGNEKMSGEELAFVAALIKHFTWLTAEFLAPMERHLATLMPLRRELDALSPMMVPRIRPFVVEDFLTSLHHQQRKQLHQGASPAHGVVNPGSAGCDLAPERLFKSGWTKLYSSFIGHSPNFAAWLQQREHEISVQLRRQHADLLCSAELSPSTLRGRTSVEVVDAVLRLTEQLGQLTPVDSARNATAGRSTDATVVGEEEESRKRLLKEKLQQLIDSLEDKELRAVLLSNGSLVKEAFER